MTDTIRVNGQSLSDITPVGGAGRVVEQVWNGVLGTEYVASLPDLVGPVWPDITATRVPREISVGLLVIGDTRADFLDTLAALERVCDVTTPVVLTRSMAVGYGTTSATARAVFLGGLDPTMDSDRVGRVMPRWQMLDATWTRVA